MTEKRSMVNLINHLSEERESVILKIHKFLPGCSVKILSDKKTRDQGWAGYDHTHGINKEGLVTEVHHNVDTAIKVAVRGCDRIDSNWHYWHHEDLELIDVDEASVKSEIFDLSNLYVG